MLNTFLLVLAAGLCQHTSIALIPNQCVRNITLGHPVCCPISPKNGQVCGGPRRGYCQKIYTPPEYIPEVLHQDDRVSWPLTFFNRACQCKNNFFGVACDSCWFGWKGPDCDQREKRVRPDVREMPQREFDLFKKIYMLSQDWPSGFHVLDESTNYRTDPLTVRHFIPASIQYYITFLHRYGSRSTLFESDEKCSQFGMLNFNHDGAVFPTWHRYFNLLWERLLAEIAWEVFRVEDFTTPYWDFIGLKHCDICNDRFIGAPGFESEDGVHLSPWSEFNNITQFCQEPTDGTQCYGCQRYGRFGKVTRSFQSLDFPDQRDLSYVMSLKDFFVPGERSRPDCLSFHMALEGFCGRPGADPTLLWMHNKVHRMIIGSMCCTATSTNDPLFIMLHNYVDKIFNTWMRIKKVGKEVLPDKDVRPGHSRESFMIGLFPLARNADMFVDSSDLGYIYDDLLFGKHADNFMPPLDFS